MAAVVLYFLLSVQLSDSRKLKTPDFENEQFQSRCNCTRNIMDFVPE